MEEYKGYDEYKESGIKWIGNIPNDWSKIRIKYLIRPLKKSKLKAGDGKNKGKYPFYTSSSVLDKRINKCLYKEKAIIMGTGGEFSIHYDKGKFSTSSDCYVFKVKNKKIKSKYLYYYILAHKEVINVIGFKGASLEHLQKDFFHDLYVFKPTLYMQQKISGFLDDKTVEIDKIINKKENLIEKLKEYKKSVITEAVTKGKLGDKYINEDGELVDEIEMKDSGVEWLGEIPRYSVLTKAKYISYLKRGAILRPVDNPDYYDEDGHWTYLNISDVSNKNKYLYSGELQLSNLGSQKSLRVKKNNVIITASATIGIPFINKIDVCIHDGFIAFTNNKISNDFLYYYLKNDFIYSNIGKTNTQKNIYLSEAKNIPILKFDKSKQKIISNYLDKKTQRINEIIKETKKSIDKYKSYKKSVIFEAVTGKIDLRDYEVEEGEESVKHNNTRKVKRESFSTVN